MTISPAFYYPVDRGYTASTNGGLINLTSQISQSAVGNTFPVITSDNRTNGAVVKRKQFVCFSDSAASVAYGTKAFVSRYAVGRSGSSGAYSWVVVPEFYMLQQATHFEHESDIGTRRYYGVFMSVGAISTGATTLTLTPQNQLQISNSAYHPIQSGDLLYLSSARAASVPTGDSSGDAAGTPEFVTVTGAPTYGSTTISVPVSAIQGSYGAGATAASCWAAGDTVATAVAGTPSGTGTFNASACTVTNGATRSQVLTLTIALGSTGALTVNSDRYGNNVVSNAARTSSTAISNGNGGYDVVIPSNAWGGTWATGDTVTLTLTGGYVAVWSVEVIPAGSAQQTSTIIPNSVDVYFDAA